jgi:anaerobic selenocysteine-containing dehydrogenase
MGTPLPYPEFPEGCLIIGTPDNPSAIWGTKKIKEGEKLTVDWLRKHNGVAVWPASYYRYKKTDGSPSGVYPKTLSKRFEFHFNYLKEINKKFGTDLPTTFYWSESRWNPKNALFSELSAEYPFQLISGRVHYAMTMTGVCPYLAETETECMKPFNSEFTYTIPESTKNSACFTNAEKMKFQKGSVSIPVMAINRSDASQLGIESGDTILVRTPLKQELKGKAYVTDEIMPGVIKTAFGPGGQNVSGTGFISNTAEYTPNINRLTDPENISPYTGMPGFGDIMVNIVKVN